MTLAPYSYRPVSGITKNGKRVWYTGKAGEGFISENFADAFSGYSKEGAQRRAEILNKMTPLHGVHFEAASENLLEEYSK